MHVFENIDFTVNINQTSLSENWEQYYANFLQNSFLPKVETILNEWDLKHPNVKCIIEEIDLDINVENLDLANLEKILIDKIKRRISEIDVDNQEANIISKVTIEKQTTKFDSLLVYLKTGVLPSYCNIKDMKHWVVDAPDFKESEKQVLLNTIIWDVDRVKRFQNLYYDKNLVIINQLLKSSSVLESSFKVEETFIALLIKQIGEQLKIPSNVLKVKAWSTALMYSTSINRFSETLVKVLETVVALNKVNVQSSTKIDQLIVQALLQHEHSKAIAIDWNIVFVVEKKLYVDDAKLSTKADNPDSSIEKLDKHLEKEQEQELKAEKLKKEKEQFKNNKLADSIKEYTKKPSVSSTKEELASVKLKELEDNLFLHTEKAGLVLLHPFLKIFYANYPSIYNGNLFLDPNRAMLLLHFAATGNDKPLDIDLTMEKTLLGIPISEVFETGPALSETEIAESEVLLQSVMEHWGVLKNNSANSLREMFIGRDGTIKHDEKVITVTVEKLAQDILLDKLPYGIGVIKLPWLKKMINTNWA